VLNIEASRTVGIFALGDDGIEEVGAGYYWLAASREKAK